MEPAAICSLFYLVSVQLCPAIWNNSSNCILQYVSCEL